MTDCHQLFNLAATEWNNIIEERLMKSNVDSFWTSPYEK